MRILVVEDEARLAALLAQALREETHEVDVCGDGADAAQQAELVSYDVIVLDWVLPGMDGLALLRRWRAKGMNQPVLLLSARGTVGERVSALRAGADDYVVKPIALSELAARVEALHRRGQGHDRLRQIGEVCFDVRARSVAGPGGTQSLSAREFAVLMYLLDRLGDVVTRSELLAAVWGPAFDGAPNVVDVYVGYIRTKLGAAAQHDLLIETVRGIGYRLRAVGPTSAARTTRPSKPTP